MPVGQTNRRAFIAALGGVAAWPVAAPGQQPTHMRRIGFLSPAADRGPLAEAFEEVLQQRGWVSGRNITIEYRYTSGRQDAVAPIVAEIAALKLDAIVAWSPPLALAMKRATQAPLVFLITFDPIEVGLVSNLAAPEGNVTGITSLASLEIIAKRLQLLKEAAPSARSVAVLISTEQLRSRGGHDALIASAQALNVQLHDAPVTTSADLAFAMGKAKEQGAEALYVWPSGFAYSFGNQIADLAILHHLPSLHPFREGALSGGLLAYAADLKQSARRGAEYIDRILNGVPPSQLPVEQLSKYELLINLKTAKTLGLDLPATLLARADEVIE
jgi:putative tryptophan/tyrosine transport system substrate-binding protein